MEFLPNEIRGERKNINRVLDLLSFDIHDLLKKNDLRFQETPLLKWDRNLIVLNQHYLISNLPQRYELLLRRCRDYTNTKGNDFERIALSLLERVPRATLHKDIKYSKFQLDGLLNFYNSSWFVECTSHPPSIDTLLGTDTAVDEDLRLTVDKCETQALRAIDNTGHPNIRKLKPKKKKGIIIILEGYYPSLNVNNAFQIQPPKSSIPRYVINYFNMKLFINQPHIDVLEDYLFWRTQPDMPIVSLDETDYWTYFVKMNFDYKYEEGFRISQQRKVRIAYSGDLFAEKPHLAKAAKE
jgi:hypothetical protein